jgi:hypothetical protein
MYSTERGENLAKGTTIREQTDRQGEYDYSLRLKLELDNFEGSLEALPTLSEGLVNRAPGREPMGMK